VTRRLLITYLSITAFALVIVVVPLGMTFAARERDRLLFDLERDAQAVGSRVEDDLEADREPDLTSVFESYDVPGGRILVVDREGISVADSERDDLGRDYATRPEISRALAGERVTGRRWSETLGTNLVYVSIPVASQGIVHGAVRITIPSSTVDQRVRDTWLRLGALAAVVLITVGIVGLLLARSVTRPVRQVEDAARRLAAGDLHARAGKVGGPPEITALARQFDATAERLEQQVDAQQRFVGDASHQLRTPLTALRLRLETLHPSPEDEPKVEAAIVETDRLARLVQSLLVLARSESVEPAVVELDLAEVARLRLDTWRPVAERDAIAIEARGPEHLSARAVDGALEQILDNLISNALTASPADSTITVRWQARSTGGARLIVTDEGPGMTPEQRSQATARFWRPPQATGGGSGLGLSIVDHLVISGGGTLTLQANPAGRGLEVVIDFAPTDGDGAAST
jgi:signal transduction histidine kinase